MVSRWRVANCSHDHPKDRHHHQMDEDHDQAMEHHQLGGGGDYGELYASSWRGRLPKALKPHADYLLVHFRREFKGAVRWFLSKKPQGFRGWLSLVKFNVLVTLVLFGTGVITFESSTSKLRDSLRRIVLFPIYFPHAVALPITANSDTPMFLGNFVGFYVVRVYAAWRGGYFLSVSRGVVLFAASVLGASEISLAALILRRFLCARPRRKHPSIESVSEALLYFSTVFLCSLIFGIFIAIVIMASLLVERRDFWQYFGTTWMATLAGMLTVTPALMNLIVWRPRPTLFRPQKLCEASVLAAVTGTVTGILFLTNLQAAIHPLPYFLFPIIILAAFRFNRVGCSVAVLFMAYVCCWASIRTKGAVYRMSGSPPVTSPKLIIQVELFVSMLGAVGIMLSAAVREKKRLARDLRTMNDELENTVSQRTQELVMANENLRESQSKAEEASQAKSDFLANMSHEIRTPIHGIMGLTALLLDSELSTDQRESLQSVKECANLLLHIINSILDLAKIEAGRVEVEFVPFNVRKLVSSTMKMLATRAKERQLDLRWDVDSAVPEWMVGDSGKIQQCLLNLVGNAVKFTQEGSVKARIAIDANYSTSKRGSSRSMDLDDQSKVLSSPLTLSTLSLRDQSIGDSTAINILEKPVEWEPKKKNGFGIWKLRNGESYGQSVFCVPVLFEVIDTGIGISKEKLKDIFTPFTQADASTSRVYGGTGLGLCIVQRFVELLGGKLLAESELDKGSTFSFSIPLGFSEAQTPEPSTVDFSGSLDNIEYSQPSRDGAGEAQLLDTLDPTSSIFNKESQEKDLASLELITEQDLIDRKELIPVDLKELGPANMEELDQVNVKEIGPVRMEELGDLRDDGWHKTLHLHVLLAEDNVINKKVAVRQLQKHGHRVTVVGDGVGALDAVIANHDFYDLVIMDVQMPNMDGLEATRRIREAEAQHGWRRLPVLGLTAHAIQGYELTCLSSGMDGYLGKPFDIDQLLRVMSKYLPVLES